ncbi:MAG: hypothetical protein H7067_02760 [Burkholderiales bacterium]|nr:hypothetical protein [Opitutaceae bacterium]
MKSQSTVPAAAGARLVTHSSSVRELKKILDERDPTFCARVERAKGQCNQAAREALRAETALRLSVEEEHRQIGVRVREGLPVAVDTLFSDEPNPILWKLLRHHVELSGGITAAGLFINNFSGIQEWLNLGASTDYPRQLESVSRLFQKSVERVEQHPLAANLYRIEDDILGAYHPAEKLVTIHWMVIAFIASNLGVNVEALTVVVVVHELAHAYTHAGLDIDGCAWETEGFITSDRSVIEGIAQHYTEVVLKKLAVRFPEPPEVFEKLLSRQTEIYKQYRTWFPSDEKRGEIMRAALLQARRTGRVTSESIRASIKEHAAQIGGSRKSTGGLGLT